MSANETRIHREALDIEPGRNREISKPNRHVIATLLGLIVAVSLAVMAWSSWLHERPNLGSIPTGGLTSISLVNGQVYYGIVQEIEPSFIKLSNVYYVQSSVQPNGQRDNKLVNRQKNDWHGPQWLLVPIDKVVMLEAVGPDSPVAKLIEKDKEGAPK